MSDAKLNRPHHLDRLHRIARIIIPVVNDMAVVNQDECLIINGFLVGCRQIVEDDVVQI